MLLFDVGLLPQDSPFVQALNKAYPDKLKLIKENVEAKGFILKGRPNGRPFAYRCAEGTVIGNIYEVHEDLLKFISGAKVKDGVLPDFGNIKLIPDLNEVTTRPDKCYLDTELGNSKRYQNLSEWLKEVQK